MALRFAVKLIQWPWRGISANNHSRLFRLSLTEVKSSGYEFTHPLDFLRSFDRSNLRYLSKNIECSDPVRFSIGRKVEDVVDKRFDRCAALKS
jgi:hypothetical protein